ncbi:MAG: beta-ketoacyl-ACP synthase II [Thermoguttaceae bacterium]|nr:beta-ketoacyl-ACP synthase II [Thermoguttaceae bacterium]
MSNRVVVTGIGLVTPLGHDVETIWKRLLNGESGVGRITLFDCSNFATQIAAEVKDWDVDEIGENVEDWKLQDRHVKFAVGAGYKAMKDAGLLGEGAANLDPERFGVYTGAGEGEQSFEDFSQMMIAALDEEGNLDEGKFVQKGIEILNPVRELEQEPNMPAAHLAAMFNAKGPNVNCLTACAASAQAIGEATELIRRGEADVMIAGGAHSMIHPFGVTGFNLLTALSVNNSEPTKASKPFDKNRDGFIIGEGAGMLILESLEHAKARGAKIYGEIAGYGVTSDAYRITDTHPEGRGAISCMKLALEDAGLEPKDVDYINAHGTSTGVNDRVESLSIREVFGKYAYQIPVSSTKSMTGHLIAAAGATECIYCLLAIRDNMAPPTINFETRDPDCDLDYVPNVARKVDIDVALSNSFGFGGQDVSLVVRRFVE